MMLLESGSLSWRRIRHEARYEDGRNAWQVAPGELVGIDVLCREYGLLQSIEGESGPEEGAEELM